MSNQDIVKAGPLECAFQSPDQVRKNIQIFRKTMTEILDPKVDILMVHDKPHIKKSGWNALNGYFGVETKTVKSWMTELPDGEYAVTVAVIASQPGREPVGRSGTCTSIEMREKHNGKDFSGLYSACHGMAETRAVGRASGAFYMVADVAAEEVEGSPGFQPQNEMTKHAKEVEPGFCSHPDDAVELIDPKKPGDLAICGKCKKPVDAGTVGRIKRKQHESLKKTETVSN